MTYASGQITEGALESEGFTIATPFDHRQLGASGLGAAAVSHAPELGDRHRSFLNTVLCDEGSYHLAELRGCRFYPTPGIGRDDIEERPIDALVRERRVAHSAGETGAHQLHRLAKKVVHFRAHFRNQWPHAHRTRDQCEALLECVAGEETSGEEAHFGSGEEHDVRALLSQPLGADGTIGEQVECRT